MDGPKLITTFDHLRSQRHVPVDFQRQKDSSKGSYTILLSHVFHLALYMRELCFTQERDTSARKAVICALVQSRLLLVLPFDPCWYDLVTPALIIPILSFIFCNFLSVSTVTEKALEYNYDKYFFSCCVPELAIFFPYLKCPLKHVNKKRSTCTLAAFTTGSSSHFFP